MAQKPKQRSPRAQKTITNTGGTRETDKNENKENVGRNKTFDKDSTRERARVLGRVDGSRDPTGQELIALTNRLIAEAGKEVRGVKRQDFRSEAPPRSEEPIAPMAIWLDNVVPYTVKSFGDWRGALKEEGLANVRFLEMRYPRKHTLELITDVADLRRLIRAAFKFSTEITVPLYYVNKDGRPRTQEQIQRTKSRLQRQAAQARIAAVKWYLQTQAEAADT
eukprot:Gregarina_sp_Poly_1__6933@NODE_3769_length_889_cov_175_686131_g2420_i0_p1_GENE_NODE_3769_length_889_cov_175_686131_g2420_i0NODE_3769_length_889_cov_175_686131_g2420_i0_p1_ORF_typecomplete_len222_score8_17LptF_LptG/PF03739_14/0_17_NODE_3769_length_889_cov_175_686131_g2420_i0186851